MDMDTETYTTNKFHLKQENDTSKIKRKIKKNKNIRIINTEDFEDLEDFEDFDDKQITRYNTGDNIEPKDKIVYIKKYRIKKKVKFICGECKKGFSQKKNYEKHILLCDLKREINTTKQPLEMKGTIDTIDATATNTTNNNVENEETLSKKKPTIPLDDVPVKTPSGREMFDMIQHLLFKYKNLEDEFEKINKHSKKTNKKINILEYLNNNHDNKNKNIIPYDIWINNLTISRLDLLHMFKYSYDGGISNGIMRNLPIENTQQHPIKCFEQNKKIYYKYDRVETDDNKQTYKWVIMNDLDFDTLIMKISQVFMKEFQDWKNEYKREIENDEDFHETYMKYMKIVLGANKSKKKILSYVKSKLYNYLKRDLKNIVEYEFTF